MKKSKEKKETPRYRIWPQLALLAFASFGGSGSVLAAGQFIGRVFDIPFDVVWHYTETVSIGVVSGIIAHFLLRFFPWGGFSKDEGTRLLAEVVKLRKEQAKILKKLKN